MQPPRRDEPTRAPSGDDDQLFDAVRLTQFTVQQRARLLILRGRVQDAKLGEGAWQDDIHPWAA
jgi:hypothetical protein